VVADRQKVVELRAAGKSLREIAQEMGLGRNTVARIAAPPAA
jgi:DNA-binding CsgD family transcriptional regulator